MTGTQHQSVSRNPFRRFQFCGIKPNWFGWGVRILPIVLCLPLLVGCGKDEPIVSYEVPREAGVMGTSVRVDGDDQMVVGIGIFESTAWFFKLAGAKEPMEEVADDYDAFLNSIRFEAGASEPTWEAPESWERLEGTAFRFATLRINTALEVSISSLPVTEELESYLRMNVDRWRREMGLPPTSLSESILESLTVEEIEGRDNCLFFILRLTGSYAGGAGRMGGPFSGGASGQGTGQPSSPSTPTVEHVTPDGWTEGRPSMFSKVSLQFEDETGSAQITVSDLAAAANRWDDNVVRWSGIVGDSGITVSEIEANTQAIDVAGVESQMIELPIERDSAEPPAEGQQTLIGVMSVRGQVAWFIRLSGDSVTVDQQRETFMSFIEGLTFSD